MARQIKLADLHPTQMTLGLREVARRQKQIEALGAKEKRDYVDQRVVPCALGPGRVLYLVDRHHMCRALLGASIDAVQCEVIGDVSRLDANEFWRFMDLRGWLHPFDAEGRRCPVTAVPRRIEALRDDPYRSLAGDLRRAEGYDKADTPFEEFIWADFLRYRVEPALVATDFDKARAEALRHARSDAARHLPGWKGKG